MSRETQERPFRYSLRTLLVVMTVFAVAVACAKIVHELLRGAKGDSIFVVMGISFAVIGVLLSLFYAVKFVIDVKNNDPDGNWLSGFGGWASKIEIEHCKKTAAVRRNKSISAKRVRIFGYCPS